MTDESDSRIAEWRHRFCESLVGRWAGALGTFSGVMDEQWEFLSDGSGTRIVLGPFGQPRDHVCFEWRTVAERVLEMRVVGAYEGGVARELDELESEWDIVRYDFRAVTTDVGVEIGLVEITASGEVTDRFGDAPFALAFRGPISRT